MAPSIDQKPLPAYSSDNEKGHGIDGHNQKSGKGSDVSKVSYDGARPPSITSSTGDQTHRMLKSRHIQLIGIGGTIGTVLYVRIFVPESSRPSTTDYFLLTKFNFAHCVLMFLLCRFKLAKSYFEAAPVACSSPLVSGVPLCWQ